MGSLCFHLSRRFRLKPLLAALVFLFSLSALASGLPSGWESYESRPNILHTNPIPHQLGQNWEKLKAAHFSFVAQLLSLYPDTDLYFLARDSEHLFDVAKLVTAGSTSEGRIHLLNVSRANMGDVNLKKYLAERGISESSLAAGKKVLFIDTGFSGTIPRNIAALYPPELAARLRTQLIVSSNPDHPSSRVFLSHLNREINSQNPSRMHGTIVSYEHMPRYTDRSSRFFFDGERHIPLSPIDGATDGSVSKSVSLRHMEDLHSAWRQEESRKAFRDKMALFGKINEALREGKKEELIKLLAEENPERKILIEAYIRDALGARANGGIQTGLSLSDLNLAETSQNSTPFSKKNELIKNHPEWKAILENPDTEIKKLFQEKNWQAIGNLVDLNVDQEINSLLIKHLFDEPATGIKRSLQEIMIEKGDPRTHQSLAMYTFSKPHTKDMPDLLRLLIEKGDSGTHQYLAIYAFSQPHTKEMPDLLRLLIEKGDSETHQWLAMATFSQPHTKDMPDLLRLLIEKGDSGTHQNLAVHAFSQPHAKDMQDLLRLLIEKGDSETHQWLAMATFSQPHTKDMPDLLRLLIEKGDSGTHQNLAVHAFSQPHAKDMQDLLRLLIEKGDSETRQQLARSAFSMPHVKEMKNYSILAQALKISDSSQRREFLAKHLGPLRIESPSSIPLASTDSGTKIISPHPSLGNEIEINGKTYSVVARVGEGKRGIVYEVRGVNGERLALKVAKDLEPETLTSLRSEQRKAASWAAAGISHAQVLVQGENFVLKSWVEGTRGDKVIEAALKGDQSFYPAVNALYELVTSLQKNGIYVGDFRPPNLMWNGNSWVIFDGGSTQTGLSLEEALKKWREKFSKRWNIPVPEVHQVSCQKWFQSFNGNQ
jgi:hypothetical protein